MKKISIISTTRADYGLLSPIIKKMQNLNRICVEVVATGTHLSSFFGNTINEIKKDGISNVWEIDLSIGGDSPSDISRIMGNALYKFADYFAVTKPDMIMVLGDRYETLAICLAAINFRIPIIHLHGGEITEGAVDNSIRHSITKMSSLHFASTEEYKNRIIQMGENPNTVFNVGAVGVENALHIDFINKENLESDLGLKLDKYALLTFHPVTLENNTAEKQVVELIQAISSYEDILFICTKANADTNGRIINELLDKYSKVYKNIKLFDSLGSKRYLSLMKNACFVIGNSSSGIIETPSFSIPTINIGDRQKGRIQAESIINCEPKTNDICKAIGLAMSTEFREKIKNTSNPYGKGSTSDEIVKITLDFVENDKLTIQKKFYDIKWGDE